MTSALPVLLFAIPFATALVAMVLVLVSRRAARWLAPAALAATLAVSIIATARVLEEGTIRTFMGGWPAPWGIEWLLNPLSALMAVLVAAVSLVAVAGGFAVVRAELPRAEAEFHACALLLVSGLMGIVATNDLFNLFVHLEVASLSAYALVASGGREAPRAAFHYLVIGSLGASLYLLGVGFLYAATGSLNMTDVAERLDEDDMTLSFVGSLLITVGLAVKMGLFPLHGWMPAAYSRAPAAATVLMAPLVTKVSAYALVRVLFWVFRPEYLREVPLILQALAWGGGLAVVLGAALAWLQTDIWRLLAYSSVSQMGIVALGAGIANHAAMTGAVLHIANDALMKSALFLAAAVILHRYGVRDVRELSRLRGRAPWTLGAIALVGFSLVGIPPLCGFFGKWYVLSGAIESRAWAAAAAVIAGSLITAAYVFRILEQAFFSAAEPAEPARPARALTAASLVPAAGVVLLGIYAERVISALVHPGLPALLAGL